MIYLVEQLAKNTTLLLLFVFIYNLFSTLHNYNALIRQHILGVIIGFVSIFIIILTPESLQIDNLDCRFILFILSGLFFSLISSIVALIIISIYLILFYSSQYILMDIPLLVITLLSFIARPYLVKYLAHKSRYRFQVLYIIGLIAMFIELSLPGTDQSSTIFDLGIIITLVIVYPLITAIIGSLILNIDAQTLTRQSQAKNTTLFQSLFNSNSIGLALVQKNGTWIKFNKYISTMLGYSEAELMKISLHDICIIDTYSHIKLAFSDITHHRADSYEKRASFIAKNGEIIQTHMAITGQRHKNNLTTIVIAIQNLTEQIKYEDSQKINLQQIEMVSNVVNLGIWDFDVIRNVVHCNEQSAHYVEKEPQQLTYNSSYWLDKIHEKDKDLFKTQFNRLFEGEIDDFTGDFRFYDPDRNLIWLLIVAKVVQRDINGAALKICGIQLDITEQQRQQEELEIAASVYTYSKESIVIIDKYANFISINNAFKELTGYNEEDLLKRSIFFLKNELQSESFYQEIINELKNLGQWQGEIQLYHKNGKAFFVWLVISSIKNKRGNLDHYIGFLRDISQQKQNKEQVWKQINYDPLTKLPNRRLLTDFLTKALYAAERNKEELAVQFLDLDGFKSVNDTLGHDQGDLLLIEASKRLQGCLRDNDIIARLGGDEFIIVLVDIKDRKFINMISQRLLEVLRKPFLLEDQSFHLSASIGVAIFPDDANNAQSLLSKADQAMYIAKAEGKDRIHFFTQQMNIKIQTKIKLIEALRVAMQNREFKLYYQPILELKTLKLVRTEVFIRWEHPTLGKIPTDQLIELAEDAHLIIELGNWVFKESISQIKKWQSKYELLIPLNINMSPIQFKENGDYGNKWVQYLNELNLPTELITIEITEDLLLEDDVKLDLKLNAYRKAGFSITLDDFGTGYSSLSCLKKYDFDSIKIDHSFISNFDLNSANITLSEAIIALAHRLNIKVIAEGIEKESHLSILQENGCDYGQGYFFNKPLTSSEFESFYLDNPSKTMLSDALLSDTLLSKALLSERILNRPLAIQSSAGTETKKEN